jgi:large subunit ribosomal protein L7/L12
LLHIGNGTKVPYSNNIKETNMAESTITKEQVKDYLGKLTVIELAQLTKELEQEWGVTAAAPMAMGAVAVASGAAAAAPAEEEQTEFTVTLKEFAADKKIGIIKEVRVITNLGLKEAKDLVEAVPKTLKEAIPKAEAEEIKKKIEAAGGVVEIK